jgi:hypothetical protein
MSFNAPPPRTTGRAVLIKGKAVDPVIQGTAKAVIKKEEVVIFLA